MTQLPLLDHERIFRQWSDLAAPRTRFVGSPGEKKAATLISESLTRLGLSVQEQDFLQPTFSLRTPPQLTLLTPQRRDLKCHIMLGSEPTPAEGIEGTMHYVGKQGVIGLLEWEKYVVTREDSQPVGYVLARPDGEAMPQPLGSGSTTLPHFVIGKVDSLSLRDAARTTGAVTCRAAFHARSFLTTCRNILTRIPGSRAGSAILLSAHYDSMYCTRGANDNASGVVALLALARWLIDNPPPRDVILAFFAAEEWALAGSTYFVSQADPEDLANTYHFVMNFDGIAEGPVLQAWLGPEVFEVEIWNVLANEKQQVEKPEFRYPPLPGSDHWPFAERGVRTCMFTRGEAIHWHQPTDLPRREGVAGISSVVRLAGLLIRELS